MYGVTEEGGVAPVKCKTRLPAGKMLVANSVEALGVLYIDFYHECRTIHAAYYRELLSEGCIFQPI